LQVRSTIQQVVEQGHHSLVLSEPKTTAARRRVALPKIAITALRTHQFFQNEERKRVGSTWTDHNLVFPSAVGTVMDPHNFLHVFRRLLDTAELPRIRFHDFRHAAAALLLARGVNPKIVSERLGHSSTKITLDVYAHVTLHMQQLAAEVMDLIFQPD
jgi:integrase